MVHIYPAESADVGCQQESGARHVPRPLVETTSSEDKATQETLVVSPWVMPGSAGMSMYKLWVVEGGRLILICNPLRAMMKTISLMIPYGILIKNKKRSPKEMTVMMRVRVSS